MSEKFDEKEYFRNKRNLEEEEDELIGNVKRLKQNIELQKDLLRKNVRLQQTLNEETAGSRIQNEISEIGYVIEKNDNQMITNLEQDLSDNLGKLRKNRSLQEENNRSYSKWKEENE